MRGQNGVIDTTRLLRQRPFGEWVNVYYDPDKITTAALLKSIKANRCPRAALVEGSANPFAAPGDTVQLRVNAKAASTLKTIALPKGWRLHGAKLGDPVPKGTSRFAVSVPTGSRMGDFEVKIELANGQRATASVAVVAQVGKH